MISHRAPRPEPSMVSFGDRSSQQPAACCLKRWMNNPAGRLTQKWWAKFDNLSVPARRNVNESPCSVSDFENRIFTITINRLMLNGNQLIKFTTFCTKTIRFHYVAFDSKIDNQLKIFRRSLNLFDHLLSFQDHCLTDHWLDHWSIMGFAFKTTNPPVAHFCIKIINCLSQ